MVATRVTPGGVDKMHSADLTSSRVSQGLTRSSPTMLSKFPCKNCQVRDRAVCGALSDEHLSQLASTMVQRHFAAGSEIVHQEEASSLFAIVLAGTIKLSRVLHDGRQQNVGMLSTLDCFGELFSNGSHDSAECVTDVTLCCFPRKRFEAFLNSHPELQHELLLQAMEQLDQARQWILALGQKSAEEKVATFILWLWQQQCRQAVIADTDDDLVINCPFTRGEIAEFLGMTLETASRQITRLRTKCVIRLPGVRWIEITDLQALRKLAEQEKGSHRGCGTSSSQ
jgi:CRP/FNR family transcriptional regulator